MWVVRQTWIPEGEGIELGECGRWATALEASPDGAEEVDPQSPLKFELVGDHFRLRQPHTRS
jgi:hypothetical protein